MRRVAVIGIGMGEVEHLTGQAVEAIRRLDVVLGLDKGAAGDLGAARRHVCRWARGDRPVRFVDAPDPPRDRSNAVAESRVSYEGAVGAWTAERADVYGELLRHSVGEEETAGVLAWGDPAFYDSTLRVLASVDLPFEIEVVPGISSLQVLAAAHRTSLTGVGRSLLVTTGRRLAEEGMPTGIDDVAVMLDGRAAFSLVDPTGIDIWWGAHLGGPGEVLVSGPLAEVAEEVVSARAAARSARGWVMDTYLLRRRTPRGTPGAH